MSIKVSEPNQYNRFNVTLASGTMIKDCRVQESDKGKFISGPARDWIDKDGKKQFVNMVSFSKADQEQIFLALIGGSVMPERDVMADMPDEELPF